MSKIVKKMLPKRKSNRITKVLDEPTTQIVISEHKVISINDLLKQILSRLPVKSLLRFKSVSKHWNSIISHKDFLALRNANPSDFPGLFYHPSTNNCLIWSTYALQSNLPFEFLPLKHDHTHFESITDIPNLSDIVILNSCHGLLLCLGYNEREKKGGYHVLNPTTKQFRTIELRQNLPGNVLAGIFLAYDPSISLHYKIVAVQSTRVTLSNYPDLFTTHMLIEIYSSQTKSWKVCERDYVFKGSSTILYDGVYWNGAINWLNPWSSPLYFKVEEEQLGTMPALVVPQGRTWDEAQTLYFGESNGYLYCAQIYDPTVQFNVYEMKKDYSEWLVKYNVDLTAVATDFPDMNLVLGRTRHCSYDVLCFMHRGDNEEDGLFMVLHIPGKFILVDNGYKIIYEYEGETITRNGKYKLQANRYIESFSSV